MWKVNNYGKTAQLQMLIVVEVLELENMAEPDAIELSDDPENVLSRLTTKANQLLQHSQSIPASYKPFFGLVNVTIHQDRLSKMTEPVHMHMLMAKGSLSEDAGLFRLLRMLLTASPLFVTAVAWRTGSSVTDPNAIAFRSVLKGVFHFFPSFPIRHIDYPTRSDD